MDPATRAALDALNRDFYERHAEAFDATRDHPWPGFDRLVERLPLPGKVRLLDVGCGNGRFARFLHDSGRDDVDYTGLDASEALLRVAAERMPAGRGPRSFVCGDLFDDAALPPGPFDAVLLLGVLHHVPGFDARVDALERLAARLTPSGFLAATVWRFGSDPRAAGRTLAWDMHPIAVSAAAVEPGDQLLRWGGGSGEGSHDPSDVVRYCHFADDEELERLVETARAQGLSLTDRFRSDGRSGELNEYLVWSRRDG